MQWRGTTGLSIDVAIGLQQHGCRGDMSMLCGEMQWRVAVLVLTLCDTIVERLNLIVAAVDDVTH